MGRWHLYSERTSKSSPTAENENIIRKKKTIFPVFASSGHCTNIFRDFAYNLYASNPLTFDHYRVAPALDDQKYADSGLWGGMRLFVRKCYANRLSSIKIT